MIHRLAIIIGSVAAAAVLAIGFAATGLGPAAAPVDAEQPLAAAQPAADGPTPTPITRVETKTIYVRPAPKPKVIHVTKRVPASTRKRPKVAVVKTTRGHGEDAGEHEGGEREDDD